MSVSVNSSNINYNNLYSEPNANSTLYNNLYNYSSAVKQSSVSSSPAAVYSSSKSYSFGTYNSQGCTTPPTSDFTELSYKEAGNATSSMFGKSSYLKEIEKIEKKSGNWAAMNKIMDDINDNHKAFINEDYNKVSDLYNKIDLYEKVILSGEIYSSSQREKVHYFRKQLNRTPATLAELGAQSSNWRILNVGDSTFHMQGDNGLMNLKFVSADGRFEAVYNEKGKLVTDSINMGSYNYAPSTTVGRQGHAVFDVEPYFRWGNTSDSPQKGAIEIALATKGIKVNMKMIRKPKSIERI